jgi:mono/diheme cytochrome c family protein
MKRWLVLALVVFLVMLVPAVVAQKGDAAAGKPVYTSKCATCHGAAGEGKPAIAKAMKVELRHLGDREVQAKSDAEWKKIIAEGSGKMKPVKLTDAEVANVLAFARTLKK